MSLLARLFNFQAGTPAIADDVDAEFNQILNALNSTSTDKNLITRYSHASEAPLVLDQLGAGPIQIWRQGGAQKAIIENDGDLSVNGLTGAAGVYTFGSIPVGPASNPTLANQLARKQYVDDRIIPFSLAWFIDDPSSFPLNSDDSGLTLFRVPAIVGGFVSKITIIRSGGSHTAGGSVTFQARKFNDSTLGAGVSFSDTNNLANTPYTEDFADVALVEGNFLMVHVTARGGTVSERRVSVNLEGYRKVS